MNPPIESPKTLNIEAIADWINQDSSHELSKEAKDAVDTVLSTHESKLKLFLIAAAKKRVNFIVKLLNKLEKISDEMLKDTRVEQATTPELIKMYATVSSDILKYLESLKDQVALIKEINISGIFIGGGASGSGGTIGSKSELVLTKDGREKLRTMLMAVSSQFPAGNVATASYAEPREILSTETADTKEPS